MFNLTLSADRPTFIRFLNPNRTFFFNLQLFLQYIDRYRSSYLADGPFNARSVFSVGTGYHQDRLLPSMTWVHDYPSVSGALIGSVAYRYTQAFSIQVGIAYFYGQESSRPAALVPLASPAAGAGPGSQKAYVENGLSAVRDRDELFLRLRYTF